MTNRLQLPAFMVRALSSSDYTRPDGGYSVTEALQSDQAVILVKRHGKAESDVADSLWSFLGSATHAVIEKGADKTLIVERRFGDEKGLHGKIDIYDAATKTLYDVKTTSKYKILNAEYDDWKKQLSLYAHLMRGAGIVVEKTIVIAILRDVGIQDRDRIPDDIMQIDLSILDTIDGVPIAEWCEKRVEKLNCLMALADDNHLPPCDDAYRWATPDTWKVYWNESTAARPTSLKNCTTKEEAEDVARQATTTKKTYRVELVRGDPWKRCAKYCNARHVCKQYNKGV